MKRIYLYLAARNKKGIKILAILNGSNIYLPTRIADPRNIGLLPGLESQIAKQVEEDKMRWELWIETAADYSELRASLSKRGYSGFPFSSGALFESTKERIVEKLTKKADLNIRSAEGIKTMIRRMKD